MLENLLEEFNKEQKIEFIRMVEGLYWTMTPAEKLRKFEVEKLNNYFSFQYKHLPEQLLSVTLEKIRGMI